MNTIQKQQLNRNGISIIWDESGVPCEYRAAGYPDGTPVLVKDGDIYFDELRSPFSDEQNLAIKEAEAFYYATRDFLPYPLYLRIVATYPYDCNTRFQRNPFFIFKEDDEEQIDFLSFDKSVCLHSFDLRLKEIECAIRYLLMRNEKTGNTWMPLTELKTKLVKMLAYTGHPISEEEADAYLVFYSAMFAFDKQDNIAGLKETYNKEAYIRRRITELMNQRKLARFTHEDNENLSQEQNAAVLGTMQTSDICIVTGGPGTGKTTFLRELVTCCNTQFPEEKIYMMAPTGKASVRIKEVFHDADISASTIHLFLALGRPRKEEDLKRIKAADIVIVDESSFLGVNIFYELLSSVRPDTKIILVGDADQLPSIEAGNILTDLINYGVPTFRLTQNFRSCGSIDVNCRKINCGETDLVEDENFVIDENPNIESAVSYSADVILTPYRKEIDKKGKKQPCSSEEINRIVHAMLYPGEKNFAPGEPILILKTNYKAGYINGEIGTASSYAIDGLNVNLSGGKSARIQNMEDVSLGYAGSIYKSQGSEYDYCCVCIPEDTGDFVTRQALYTAVSRAKHKVVVVGKKESIMAAIANNRRIEIRTFLNLWAKHLPVRIEDMYKESDREGRL